MRKYLVVIYCIFSILYINAQKKWTLRECIDFAIKNNIEIKQQELLVKSAEIDLNLSKNSRLPDLNASMSGSYNMGRSSTGKPGDYVNRNALNSSMGISSSTPIFTGFRIPNQIKSSEFNLKATIEGFEKAKNNMELQIASYYLDILFKKELLKVYMEQAALTEKQVEKTQILVESGRVALSQLYDIKAQLAKDDLNVTNANNDLNLSYLNLSQLLNLRSSADFDISEPSLSQFSVSSNHLNGLMNPDEVYQKALTIKPHIKEALYKIESSKYNMKVAQSGYWPTLNFGLNYSNSLGHIYGNDVVNPPLSEQFKNNYQAALGITINIPIFNRFETRNKVRKARVDIQNQDYNLMNVKLALYKEIQQAYQNALAAEAKYTSTQKAYGAALESFRYAEERYRIGKSTVFEYNEAQTKLVNSQSEQIQAKYDFIFRSKILDFYQGKEINI